MAEETCVCGHVFDEHDRGGACTIEVEDEATRDGYCPCAGFEPEDIDG